MRAEFAWYAFAITGWPQTAQSRSFMTTTCSSLLRRKQHAKQCTMGTENEAEVQIAARISKSTYGKILDRQKKARRLTGIEPSISAVVRAMIEEAAGTNGKRR